MKVSKWEDVTLGMYIDIVEVLKELSEDEDSNSSVGVISIILDKSIDEIRDMDYDKYLDISNKLTFMNEPIPTSAATTVMLGDATMHLLPFNQLEFGAFIDIEHYFSDKETYIYNLPKIFSILYRQELTPAEALNKATYEPYGDWLDVRGLLFENVPVTALYGLITQYMNFRSRIYKNYEGLFQQKEDIDDDDEEEFVSGMTSKEREAYEHEKAVGTFGWDLFLLRLAGGDPTKMFEATKMPIIMALNILGMQSTLKMG